MDELSIDEIDQWVAWHPCPLRPHVHCALILDDAEALLGRELIHERLLLIAVQEQPPPPGTCGSRRILSGPDVKAVHAGERNEARAAAVHSGHQLTKIHRALHGKPDRFGAR